MRGKTSEIGRAGALMKGKLWPSFAIWAVAYAVNNGYPTLYLPVLPSLMNRWHLVADRAGLLVRLLPLPIQTLQPIMGSWANLRGVP